MYLSQLLVDPRNRQARHDLSDRYELHRTLSNAFPEQLPEHERILYRIEEGRLEPIVRVLVQSHTMPDWNVPRLQGHYLLQEPEIRCVTMQFEVGQRMMFRLQANPTVKRDGKRHAIYDEAELQTWLQRKGENNGFAVNANDFRINKMGKKFGKNRQQVWHAVQFDGMLTVTDVEAFQECLQSGVGSAKAFGFGLLSVPLHNA